MSLNAEFFKKTYRRFEILIKYFLFGCITSVLNLGIFFVGTNLWNPDKLLLGFRNWEVINAVAWLVANLYSFYANRKYVFHSKTQKKSMLLREITVFFGSRLISFMIATYAMSLLINHVDLDHQLAKLIGVVLEVIINYFTCKFIVFKKRL